MEQRSEGWGCWLRRSKVEAWRLRKTRDRFCPGTSKGTSETSAQSVMWYPVLFKWSLWQLLQPPWETNTGLRSCVSLRNTIRSTCGIFFYSWFTLDFSTVSFWTGNSLLGGGYPVHYRMLSSILGLCPIDANGNSNSPSWWSIMSPDIAKGPLVKGRAICPQDENHTPAR